MYYMKRMLDLGFLDWMNVILKIIFVVLLYKIVDIEYKEIKIFKFIFVDFFGEDLDYGV